MTLLGRSLSFRWTMVTRPLENQGARQYTKEVKDLKSQINKDKKTVTAEKQTTTRNMPHS